MDLKIAPFGLLGRGIVSTLSHDDAVKKSMIFN